MKPSPPYRFPAEWETHEATWLTWPHNPDTWPSNLPEAQSEFDRFARTLAEVEQVRILATDEIARSLQLRFQGHSSVDILQIPTNDSWIRDYGPTFVIDRQNGTVAGIDWTYDGWGEKYPPFDDDQVAARKILETSTVSSIPSRLILEGGAIETNGVSTCLTTQCILKRNLSLSKQEVISELAVKTGMEKTILLDSLPIQGDDTDGHIDQVARFVSQDRVVVSHQQMESVRQVLLQADIDMIELPDPKRIEMFGSELPCRYTNFYIANGIVIVPAFEDPSDERAVAILCEQFPHHQVIPLPSRNLAVGLGSFHCLTQQQPQGRADAPG